MSSIQSPILKTVLEVAYDMFPRFLQNHEMVLTEKKGIYVVGVDLRPNGNSSLLLQGALIGWMPPEKMYEKMKFANEKINRLLTDKYYTTFPTQDYSQGKYGGGITDRTTLALASSNLPPEYDHLFVSEIMKKCIRNDWGFWSMVNGEFNTFKDRGKS